METPDSSESLYHVRASIMWTCELPNDPLCVAPSVLPVNNEGDPRAALGQIANSLRATMPYTIGWRPRSGAMDAVQATCGTVFDEIREPAFQEFALHLLLR